MGGKHAVQYTDDVLQNYIYEIHRTDYEAIIKWVGCKDLGRIFKREDITTCSHFE